MGVDPVMSNQNGTSGRRRVHAIDVAVVFEVEVERNGAPQTVEITGYVKGACPVWVEIETSAAWKTWRDVSYAEGEFKESERAEAMLRRDMLMAVTRGLEEHEADVLAADGGGWLDILRDLGWWGTNEPDEDAPAPEAVGEPVALTGSPSLPESPGSTALATG